MSKYTTEHIASLPAVPASNVEGPKLNPPEELVKELVHYADGSSAKREIINELLEPSDLQVEWSEVDGGWHKGSYPEGAYGAMVANLAVKQSEAQEIYDISNERLPVYKKQIASGLAQYGHNLGVDYTGLEELFTSRIANISEVKLVAPVAQGNSNQYIRRRPDVLAGLEKKKGELQVDVQSLQEEVETNRYLTFDDVLSRAIVHELEHGESVGSTTPDGSWLVQSGLGVFPKIDNGGRDWHGSLLLEEGAQEQIRWRHLDKINPVYEKGVMSWEAVIALNPDIEKLRFEAKFLGKNRGVLIGSIESILGPLAVEELESFWSSQTGILSYPDFKDKFISMINIYDPDPQIAREKTSNAKRLARDKLDQTQSEILAPRGWDFTDAEMRLAKANGAKSSADVRDVISRT